jgi:ferrous iron transport protein A
MAFATTTANKETGVQAVQLNEAQPGVYRVVVIRAPDDLANKLADLGIHAGDKIEVLSNQGVNGVVVGRGDARIALDQATAERIRVLPLAGEHVIGIAELRPGEKARVVGLKKGDRDYRQRLMAMGLTPGVEFALTRVAPLGDPVEIGVRGSSLSLRKGEAELLMVEKV